jgi:uncharacterized protein (DUF362 family)
MDSHEHSRRQFLKSGLIGGAAWLASPVLGGVNWAPGRVAAQPVRRRAAQARVALTTGEDRADMAFRALHPFRTEIAQAIGDRLVVIKPNNVQIHIPLSSSHAETLHGILEFLKSIGKDRNVVIAESCAAGSTLEGFANYGYNPLASKYGVRLVDLDQGDTTVVSCLDERGMRPHPVRVASLLLDPGVYVISTTRFKTHDRVIATLSLKNIVVGAPIKGSSGTQKPLVHGGGIWGINYNLAALAPRLHPHLAVLDGCEGMEGNGPTRGTPVNQRVCVASPDWLAADRVAVELMGIDFATVGYLNYCAEYGLGETDLARIEILGPALAEHTMKYRLPDSIANQLTWQQPIKG